MKYLKKFLSRQGQPKQSAFSHQGPHPTAEHSTLAVAKELAEDVHDSQGVGARALPQKLPHPRLPEAKAPQALLPQPVLLQDVLKLAGWVDTGGEAKFVIQSGKVNVNGQLETRRKRKLLAEDVISFSGKKLRVHDVLNR